MPAPRRMARPQEPPPHEGSNQGSGGNPEIIKIPSILKNARPKSETRLEENAATELTVSEDEGILDLDSDELDSLDPSRPVSGSRSRSRSGVRRSRTPRVQSAAHSEGGTAKFDVEIARMNAEAMKEGTETVELGVSVSDFGNMHVLRGKANTPASFFTADFSELKALEDADDVNNDVLGNRLRSHNPPRTPGTESCDAAYRRAMSLMAQRCSASSRQRMSAFSRGCRTPLVSVKSQSYGVYTPKAFLIHQKKPAANIPPLQAWRGYHGNVYFQPITVSPAQFSLPPDTDRKTPDLSTCSGELQQILKRRSGTASTHSRSVTSATAARSSPSRGQLSRGSNRSAVSTKSRNSLMNPGPVQQLQQQRQRKMAILDKRTVLNNQNDNIQEDITWIVGQESTGSLSLQPEQEEIRNRPPGDPHRMRSAQSGKSARERIIRGSMIHKEVPKRKRTFPAVLSVTGDKFTPSQPAYSPLLRTQTQYSESSQRLALNSPDPYHNFSKHDKMHPLEELRASVRHIGSSSNQDALPVNVIPPLERMKFEEVDPIKSKPFVKYSAEVRNSANGHLRGQRAK